MSHVLIIDDEDDIRRLVALILTSSGYTVTEAGSGAEGYATLVMGGVDCVLLDINMPVMNGWEVCRQMKADPTTAHIPVIIFTVRAKHRDQAEYDSVRPDGFISKPFDRSELLQTMQSIVH